MHLIPLLALVMTQAPASSQRDAQALQTLQAWDGSRLDGDGDGKIDAPAAALTVHGGRGLPSPSCSPCSVR